MSQKITYKKELKSQQNQSFILNERQLQAAGLLARGYSPITTSHVLGISRELLEQWLIMQEFKQEIMAKKQQGIGTMF